MEWLRALYSIKFIDESHGSDMSWYIRVHYNSTTVSLSEERRNEKYTDVSNSKSAFE
jgi:hypothetical protein